MQNDPERSRRELERALGETPAYQRWRDLDPGPRATVDDRFAALPLTSKDDLRAAAPRGFAPVDADFEGALARGEIELVTTSGTTGAPTSLVWVQAWWNASEAASWQLNRNLAAVATGTHRECVLASARCVGPPPEGRPRSMSERTLGRLLFLNETADVALWSDTDVRRMADELARHRPPVLEADASYLAAFCARAEALSLSLFCPAQIVVTYGRPSRLQLARIGRSIPAPVASSYGSTETGYVFLSCERGKYHQNVASCRVDLLPFGDAPSVARLAVTPFSNPWMCLLRYDVGDLVRVAPEGCACGRVGGNVLDDVLGRVEDVSWTAGGKPITAAALDDAVAEVPAASAIVSYQVEQERPGDVHLRAVALGRLDEASLVERLRSLYGGRAIVESVPALEPRASGKYPYRR